MAPSKLPARKVSGKQVSLIIARFKAAGFFHESAFLEWLEYESGLDLFYPNLESIEAARLDQILEKLSEKS